MATTSSKLSSHPSHGEDQDGPAEDGAGMGVDEDGAATKDGATDDGAGTGADGEDGGTGLGLVATAGADAVANGRCGVVDGIGSGFGVGMGGAESVGSVTEGRGGPDSEGSRVGSVGASVARVGTSPTVGLSVGA